MATLLTSRDLSKTYGTHTLFSGVSLSVHDDDRLALIGPNGSGKSTLLKILAGLETPDTGDVTARKNLRLAYVAQADTFADGATVRSAVVDHLTQSDPADPRHEHDHESEQDRQTRAAITLSRLGFVDHDQPVATLSGGWRKRLAIAQAIATEPDVLMLDEPTNHLDLEGVLWLESFVRPQRSPSGGQIAFVFITHDRVFLESTATRVVELSRAYPGGTFEAKGNYSAFVRRKNDFLDAQAAQQSALAGKVRRDTAWLKQGVQGRQTRNKSQVQDAAARRDQLKGLAGRNKAPKETTTIDFAATDRKTNRLLALHNVSKAMGGRDLFRSLDLLLTPGQCLGLLGPNGSGKTTLLRILSGDLEPDTGSVKPAAELRIVNFTQHREALNPTQNLREALCPVGDVVQYHGKAIHVSAWAKKFLFDPGQFNTSVGDLSGGEQARILIANLMLQPADVLILDEPTNDLDIPSLEVLEQALTEFPGAIVLVTHDRFLLQRLSTELLALDGRGHAKLYPDYFQWQQAQQAPAPGTLGSPASPKPPHAAAERGSASEAAGTPPKLTYKLQHELDRMEASIVQAEKDLERWQAQLDDPSLLADHARYALACEQVGDAQQKVDALYARWAELEAMQQVGGQG